jgi:serine/threonine kinase PknH
MTVSAEESRVGTTFGKYKITGLLGKGGMGEVYEAHDNEIGRTVALKIIKSQFADDRKYRIRFERESHATAKLQEPHVIPIHGYGEIDGCLFIDMRLVRGTDLQRMIDKGPLDATRAVAIITQVAAALDAAHAEGLIHRDVKPQNIIVTPADFAYLVDFGIAEVMGDTRLTAAGAQIGSLAYMAPERISDQEITPAIDIYALTCVLYESLTGQMPFPVDSPQAQAAAHMTLPPPQPSVVNPKVPASFDDVIARGMAKEPDDRYGSAGALGRAANRALKGVGHTAVDLTERMRRSQYPPRPPMPPPQPHVPGPVTYGERPRDRARWLLPIVIAVSAALVLGAIGIVIGLLAKLNSTRASTAAPAIVPTTPMSPTAGLPPLVTGPDQSISHTSCDQGYQVANGTGFGTHAGRGSAGTSCFFANSVQLAYWNAYGNASTAQRSVSAQGAVPCNTVPGASCDPKNTANFLMQCAGDGSNPWIKCTGGKDAVVYLW